jgi:hypothetical protein
VIMDLPGPAPIGRVIVRGIPSPPLPDHRTSPVFRRMHAHQSAEALINLVLVHAEVLGHDAADYAEWMASALDCWATEERKARERGYGYGAPPEAEAAE